MDIGSGKGYPASALSNFTPRRFSVDGVECNSMEGFLQSLKFKDSEMQKYVCTLVGLAAKRKGQRSWWKTQTLYWQGQEIGRHSEEYQQLLDKAYQAMFDQCESFRKALIASGDSVLKHSIGRTDPSHTVLTVSEFCGRLTKLREKAFKYKD
jgi:predicted NAD-dependent protein-ADP-ribosyltransferase YbiA (DUF1768 family)